MSEHVSIEVRGLNRKWGEVKFPRLGWVRFRCSSRPAGDVRHATVMRTPLGWEVSLCVEDGKAVAPGREAGPAVGVDAGVLGSFATSDAGLHQVPQPGRGERERRLARQRKGSRRRERSKRELARVGASDARRRLDPLHKLATDLVRGNALIAIEDLKVGA